jgi:hypothetical protein
MQEVEVVTAQLGNSAGLIGAAALPFEYSMQKV